MEIKKLKPTERKVKEWPVLSYLCTENNAHRIEIFFELQFEKEYVELDGNKIDGVELEVIEPAGNFKKDQKCPFIIELTSKTSKFRVTLKKGDYVMINDVKVIYTDFDFSYIPSTYQW